MLTPLLAAAIFPAALLVEGSIVVSPRAATAAPPSSFQTCVKDLSPVYQSSADYAAAFNQRFTYKPIAIVYPDNANEVSVAVKCAAQASYKVSARSGGHSYAAYGLGGEDGHLVISLDKLNYVNVDSSTKKARIGGGTKLGTVASKLWAAGQRGMPHGTCPYVGVGGHFSGGGFGLTSRKYGLAMDSVEEITVVLASGDLKVVSKDNDKDLFWAMRGAGSSFAIATEFKVNTFAAPPEVYHFSYQFKFANSQAATKAFLAYQIWAASNLPAELGPQLNLFKDTFNLDGMWYGANSQAQAQAALQPLLAQLPKPTKTVTSKMNYIDSVKLLTGNPSKPLDVTGTKDSRDTFFANGLFVTEDKPLTEVAVKSFFDYLYNQGAQSSTHWFVQADIWGGNLSAIRQVGNDDTSFPTRNALYGWQFYTSSPNYSPPLSGQDLQFAQGFSKSITSKLVRQNDLRAYVNYVDSTLSAADAQKLYYGSHLDKLKQIKLRVDPDNRITNPQAIGR